MIREINANDFDGMMKLYTELHNNPIPEKDEHVLSIWNRIINDKDHHIIVAEEDGSYCGFVCVCNHS